MTRLLKSCICTSVLALLLPLAVSAQDKALLKAGTTATFRLGKTESKTLQLRPQKGRSYTIEAEQRGIDIRLLLRTRGGRELADRDSPNGMYGPEIIRFDAADDSVLLLTVSPLQEAANAAQGKVSVVFREALPEARAIDRELTPQQMQRDLRTFRLIREQANSGFLRYRTQTEMDSIYARAAALAQRPMKLTAFYKIILELTDAEGSCHNSTELPRNVLAYFPEDGGYFPYYLKRIGPHMVLNYSGAPIPLGARILSINGIPDSVLIRRFFKYFPTDGYNRTAKERLSVDNSFGWRYLLEYGTQDSFRISYQTRDMPRPAMLTIPGCSLAEKRRHYEDRHSAPFEKYLDNGSGESYSAGMIDSATALLHIRRFDMASNAEDPAYAHYCRFLDSLFSGLKARGIPNLVIDVRNNPGGNDPTYEKLFSYLTDHPFRENTLAWINFGTIPLPQYYLWNSSYKDNQHVEQAALNRQLNEMFSVKQGTRYLQTPANNPVYEPDSGNRFTGNVYLLIDENVASAASHFASLVRGHSKATILGVECTGGYYGHNGHFPVEYVLPESRIQTRFSIVWVEQDAPVLATQPPGRGIIPDITVHQSFEDFMTNEDTQLKAVLELIRERSAAK